MPEWKKYDGTDEQIAEIFNAKGGFIVDSQWSIFKDPNQLKMSFDDAENVKWLKDHFEQYKVKYYMLCNPHPLADMIIRQAQTGQPVWYQAIECPSFTGLCMGDEFNIYPFARPDKYRYSFAPFEEVVINNDN